MELLKEINKTNLEEVTTKYKLEIIDDINFPNLYLLKYSKDSEFKNLRIIKECRGIILEKKTNKIICYGLDKTEDILNIDKNKFKDYIIEDAIDGTQIRLFYYCDKWSIATARCIDAYKSKWNYVKSYGILFDDVKKYINFDLLNKNYTYTFIIKHIENRIIENVYVNDIYHIHTRNNITLEVIDHDIKIKKPSKYNFNNLDEIYNELEVLTFNNMGYVIKNMNYIFILKSPEYIKIKELKGNNFNIKYLYLNLKINNKLNEFIKYFPEYNEYFKNTELNILHLINDLHKLYIKKFIKKEKIININKLKYHCLYNIHKQYLTSKAKTTSDNIAIFVNKLPTGLLIKLI